MASDTPPYITTAKRTSLWRGAGDGAAAGDGEGIFKSSVSPGRDWGDPSAGGAARSTNCGTRIGANGSWADSLPFAVEAGRLSEVHVEPLLELPKLLGLPQVLVHFLLQERQSRPPERDVAAV